MSNTTMILTFAGLSAMFLACKKYSDDKTIEGFVPVQRKVELVSETKVGDSFVSVAPSYQARIPPRPSGMVNYGTQIRYNMPCEELRGDSLGSVDYASMVSQKEHVQPIVVEGYCGSCEGYCGSRGSCKSAGCRAGAVNDTSLQKSSNIVPASFASGNYQQQYSQVAHQMTSDVLPVQSMDSTIHVDALGQEQCDNVIVYDRLMYAPLKSRNIEMSNLRADIPIATDPSHQGWFKSRYNENDLHAGALAVMGGMNNENTQALLALKSATQGQTHSTGSGVNYGVQQSSYLSHGGGDVNVNVTAFP
jgi:hypothetical protein